LKLFNAAVLEGAASEIFRARHGSSVKPLLLATPLRWNAPSPTPTTV
jgi:hypothetical protein